MRFLLSVAFLLLATLPALAQVQVGDQIVVAGVSGPIASGQSGIQVVLVNGAEVRSNVGIAITLTGTESSVFVAPTAQVVSTVNRGISATGSLRVFNDGFIASGPGFFAVSAAGSMTLVNTGRIQGSTAFVVRNDGPSTITNFGSIVGQSGGLDLDSGTVVNFGSIVTRSDTVEFDAGFGMVVNAGLLQSTGADDGVSFESAGGGTLLNTGTIIGFAEGVESLGGALTVTNSGTIRAGTEGIESFGPTTVVNSGGIAGVAFSLRFVGNFDDRVELHTGSVISGTMDFGADGAMGDSLHLFGSGTLPVTVNNLEFLENHGFWDLTGTVNVATRTSVLAGRLRVHGILAGAGTVRVGPGAVLGGTGMINQAVVVESLGTLDPGASIGTLTINAATTFQAGSALAVELQGRPDMRSDRLIVNAALTLDPGARLAPVLTSGYFRHGDTYRVVDATAIGGSFSVVRPSAAIGLRAVQTATSVDLVVERTPYADLAATRNHRSIGLSLDGVIDTADGDLRQVLNEMDKLHLGELRQAFSMIDPVFFDAHREAALAGYRSVLEAVAGRPGATGSPDGLALTGNLFQLRGDLLADGGGVAPGTDDPWSATGLRAWFGAHGLFAERDENDGAFEIEYESTGPRFGWDYAFAPGLSIGMFGAITLTEVEFPDRASGDEAEHDAYTVGLVGSFDHESGVSAHAMVFGGVDDYESRRGIFFGTIARTATSEHDGYHVGGRAGGQWLWRSGPWGLGPIGHADYLHQDQASFRERGAGSLDLLVEGRDVESLQTGLGLLVRFDDAVPGETFVWVPEFRAQWLREWLDDDRTIEAALAGGPRLSVSGDDPTRDAVRLGVGFEVKDGEWFGFGVHYDAILDEDGLSHTLRGAFEIRF